MTIDTDQHALGPDVRAFLERVIDQGMVWALHHRDGWALAPSADNDSRLVLPLWSVESMAVACATEDWADYRAEPIVLDELLEAWLPGLEKDGYLAGIDWTDDLEGIEVPPLELQVDLETLIEQLDPGGEIGD